MVQSMNTKVDYTVAATSYLGMANYGKVMIGDKASQGLYPDTMGRDRLCDGIGKL